MSENTVQANPDIEDVIKLKVIKREAAKQGRVKVFLQNEEKNPESKFILACNSAKVKPTKRQASKWLSKKGAAWKEANYANSI